MNRTKHALIIIILTYLFLSIWTIVNSPNPKVDTFILFKEAPLTLLEGKNPYTTLYTQVYKEVNNYFPYLPFSLFYILPFLILLKDPRFGILFANLISAFIMYKLTNKKNIPEKINYIIFTFLFLPRSFYMLEHMYLDTIIFSFFLLFYYFYQVKKYRTAFFFLALSFSFKIHILFILLPLLIKKTFLRHLFLNKNYIFFLLPIFLPILFLINSPFYFINTIIHLVPNTPITYIGPISMNLSFTNFLSKFIFINNYQNVYLIGVIIFIILYVSILLKKNLPFTFKSTSAFLLFQYFTYMSFFNHYYFVVLLFFLFILSNAEPKDIASHDSFL